MNSKNKQTWIGILILITIEQGIKIIINNHFLTQRMPILPPLLYFAPMFNRHYSWLNSMLQLGIGKWVHIAIVALMSILIFMFYRYLNKQLGQNNIINVLFAFLFSGAMCSLIDKIFWNGSLDYILVRGFFTFDLKDVYINIFGGLLVFSWLSGNKAFQQINDQDLLKGFTNYLLRK